MEKVIEGLKACDNALNSCDMVVKSQDGIIKAQGEELDLQAQRISELEAEQNSLWSNPLVWFAVGAAAGIAGGVLLSR